MAGGVGGEMRRGDTAFRPLDWRFFKYVTATTYLLMAVTGLGYLALMWSTVVLLGGFVTVLQKKDFWCLTVISMTQAARIFNDFAEDLVPNFVSMLAGNILVLVAHLHIRIGRVVVAFRRRPAAMSTWCSGLGVLFMGAIVLPFQVMSCVTVYLYRYSGPIVCITLALWRIIQRDYGGDDSSGNSNLMPALNIFYSLVLVQGGLYFIWALWPLFDISAASFLGAYRRQLDQPDKGWCSDLLVKYLSDTRARCWREPASIRGRTLCDFAVNSLDSGSWEDMLSGVRLLDAFIMQGANIRSQILPSRPRLQKLIDALGWRQQSAGASSWEMREPAARIVAHLAGDIYLSQYPGAMECISSLFLEETTLAKGQDDGSGARPNELILQGLAILDGLAFNGQNCRVILSSPGLLRKVMAPLSSANLIHDIGSSRDWANVVCGSIMVLSKLIKAPGKIGRRLRREIYCNEQSMSNLEGLLYNGHEAAGLVELQMGAMLILTQLALDPSINFNTKIKESLIKKQLQIFLADGEIGEGLKAAADLPCSHLKACAGRALVSLSNKIETNIALIITAQTDIMGRLTGVLDAKNTTTYRTIAAHILENLCGHCDMDKQWVNETLLPKVLAEILSSKRATPQNKISPPTDEENQQNSAPRNDQDNKEIKETSSIADQNKTSDRVTKDQTTNAKLMQEAFLSLALAVRDKLISENDFDDAVQKKGLGPGEFVAKIKIIVEENCQETAESLRIVKLCGRIVEPLMQHDNYAQHFRNKDFVESLSNASKIMSNLESSMLFAGTDFGPKKTIRPLLSFPQKKKKRPLLSDIKKSASQMVG